VTAQEWLENSSKWTKGPFMEVHAEELEQSTEQYFNSISKAVKYFQKNAMDNQLAIANLIKVTLIMIPI